MSNRPIAPHLSVYQRKPHMIVSILHRITGDGMAVVGVAVLLWWLGALASGPEAYGVFHSVMASPIGYIVLIGLSWAFFNHMASGLRHFVMDIGAGYELKTNETWSVGAMVIGVLLTAAFWAVIFLR